MSGEKDKKNKLNSGVEFFYKLSMKSNFMKDIKKARKQLGIPENGFSKPETRKKLWIEDKKANMLGILSIELFLKQKYEIPTPYYLFIDDYIFFGKPLNALKRKSPVAVINPTKEIEDFYNKTNELTVKLLIFKNVTPEKLFKFIKKNWREIELNLNKNVYKKTRVRSTIYKERSIIIKDLSVLPVKELQKEAGSDSTSKDILIAKILVRRGITLKELSYGYIRKIIYQKQ